MVALSRRRLLCCCIVGGVSLALTGAAMASPDSETRELHVTCAETGDSFDDVYWVRGNYLPDALARLDWLLRDFHRDEATRMDPALIDLLSALAHRLRTRHRFLVTSAYRAPQTNARLQREGWPAADHSTHMLGKAVDVRLERVPVAHLYRAARAVHGGGIGIYPGANFIHLDTGPVRLWDRPELAETEPVSARRKTRAQRVQLAVQ